MHELTGLQTMISGYGMALMALALLCVAVLVQSLLTAPLAFVSGEQQPGSPLRGDHNLRSFRVIRTHANSVESLPAFGFSVLVAIAAGVGETLVNWAALAHLVFRLGFWVVYYLGVGKVAGGPRTLCFVGGLAANFVLAGACVVALTGS